MSLLDEVRSQVSPVGVMVSQGPTPQQVMVAAPQGQAQLRKAYLKLVSWLPQTTQIFYVDEMGPHFLMVGMIFPMPADMFGPVAEKMRQMAEECVKQDEVTERILEVLRPCVDQKINVVVSTLTKPGMVNARSLAIVGRSEQEVVAAHKALAEKLPAAKITVRVSAEHLPQAKDDNMWAANLLFKAESLTQWLLEQS